MPSLQSIFLLILLPVALYAQENMFSIRGKVLEKGTKNPVTESAVYLLPSATKTTTDLAGNFEFTDIASGEYEIVVNLSGYEKYSKNISLSQNASLSIYVQRLSYAGSFETKIISSEKKRDLTQKSISANEFLTQAGGGQDPIRAVQNLPGIARSPGFSAQVVIQGSAPEQTAYLLDGHEVPFIFHFGGLNTVLFPEAVETVDYLSAGYGPEYGRALGGLVGVRTRSPRTDRWRGIGYVDIINAGALVEGGFGKNHGFMLSARQSYIGEILKAASSATDSFSLTTAPKYSDLTAVYEYKHSDAHRLKFTGITSFDGLEFVIKDTDDPFFRGKLESDTTFFRIIPQYYYKPSPRYESDHSVGFGWTKFRVQTDTNVLSIKSWGFTPKAEWRFLENPNLIHFIGMDHRITLTQADVLLPDDYAAGGVFNPLSSGNQVFVDTFRTYFNLGFYHRMQWKTLGGKLMVNPGFRIDYFSETDDLYIDPRVSLKYNFTDTLSWKVSGGLYHQAPEPRQINAAAGNPNLNGQGAWHVSSNVEKDFAGTKLNGLTASVGPFFRKSYDLATESTQLTVRDGNLVPENYNNSGSGYALGTETFLKYRYGKYNAAIAYTLLRSRLDEPVIGEYPNPFDQTHNFNFLGSVNLTEKWTLSTRVRYVTGNPYTPIVGSSFDADNNVFIPVRGPYYSSRLGDFFQWDVRIDKRWIFNRWILSLYLDLQNVTNRGNAEAISYSFNYSQKESQTGLPFIPSFGIKGEF